MGSKREIPASNRRRRVLAVRHGESQFNVFAAKEQNPSDKKRQSFELVDCSITDKGAEQSREAGRKLATMLDGDTNILFVVSPLRRALQTTRGILETCPTHDCRLVVHPSCSEVMVDVCDIGTPVEDLEKEFSEFDYQFLRQNDDKEENANDNWWPFGRSPEETWEHMQSGHEEGLETETMAWKRFEDFGKFISSRPESTIVVVCHSETIWWLTSQVKGDNERYGTWTENGEILDITVHLGSFNEMLSM